MSTIMYLCAVECEDSSMPILHHPFSRKPWSYPSRRLPSDFEVRVVFESFVPSSFCCGLFWVAGANLRHGVGRLEISMIWQKKKSLVSRGQHTRKLHDCILSTCRESPSPHLPKSQFDRPTCSIDEQHRSPMMAARSLLLGGLRWEHAAVVCVLDYVDWGKGDLITIDYRGNTYHVQCVP